MDVAFWAHQFLKPEARSMTGAILEADGERDHGVAEWFACGAMSWPAIHLQPPAGLPKIRMTASRRSRVRVNAAIWASMRSRPAVSRARDSGVPTLR
ncbi:hypothetical protein [Nonomuraea diastatica]|uniref:hypothetical protein n=1 Tax=Nonomuraea diastatica TaxID=1848329 RepID=UPI00140B217A|nr:hypothetical protein [Nonomuraea diastatica]